MEGLQSTSDSYDYSLVRGTITKTSTAFIHKLVIARPLCLKQHHYHILEPLHLQGR